MRRLATVTILATLAVAGAAACGSSSSDGSGSGATSSDAGPATTATTGAAGGGAGGATELKVADSGLGDIVVDGQGRTLYLFTADQGTTTACTGGCAAAWPALVAPVTASSEVTGDVGQATQADGSDQVTLGGHLLYYYASDTAPGDTTGQGVGGKWFVVDPSGKAVEKAPSIGSGY